MKLFKYETEKEQLEAVKEDGYNIRYINNPSEKVQLAAVKQNAEVISYIHNPSEEVQLSVIKKDPLTIQYIHNPSEKVIKYLIVHNASCRNAMQLLFAKIGKDEYDKLSDEDKLSIELGD